MSGITFSVTSTPSGMDCDDNCTGKSASFTSGTSVSVEATGINFQNWSWCDTDAGQASCDVTVSSNRTIVGIAFASVADSLQVKGTGNASCLAGSKVTTEESTDPINCPYEHCFRSYGTGQLATLTATTAPGCLHLWGGDGVSCIGSTCTLTITGTKVVNVAYTSRGENLGAVSPISLLSRFLLDPLRGLVD